MHYVCEIVMPPTDNVAAAVAAILEPFNENNEDGQHGFFDWYVIGGRFAGRKMRATLGEERMSAFHEWLTNDAKVTVSGLIAGKQKLVPTSQAAMVDAKWSEMFPEASGPCPLFAHSNDQYAGGLGGTLPGDICTVDKIPMGYGASRVIICEPSFVPETKLWAGPITAAFMLTDEIWNGCNYMKVDWDGLVSTALSRRIAELANRSGCYREAATPQQNWLTVTVDCHS